MSATRDRTIRLTFGTRAFTVVIDGADPHDWRLADETERPAFELAWREMEAQTQQRRAA